MYIGVSVRIFGITIFFVFDMKKIVFISENLCVLIPESDCVVIRDCQPTKKGNVWKGIEEVVPPARH
jgi:hypothetical protein